MREPFNPVFFRRLQQLKIRTRKAFLGTRQGSHISLRRGHGLEFSDFRLYTAGDDFRHIDWGAYGRTDRLYIKQFREEQNLNVMIFLDASRSMGFPENSKKFNLAKDLALALGYISLSNGDSVTFSVLGQKTSPSYIGQKAFSQAIKMLDQTTPHAKLDLLSQLRRALAQHRIPGKCFLISDFLLSIEDLFQTLDLIRSRNFEIVLIQILAPEEMDPNFEQNITQIVDAETEEVIDLQIDSSFKKEYANLLATHLDQIKEYCAKSSVSHLVVKSNEDLKDIVLTKLPEIGVLK